MNPATQILADKRLKLLEQENARLKGLLADAHVDVAILKEACRGN